MSDNIVPSFNDFYDYKWKRESFDKETISAKDYIFEQFNKRMRKMIKENRYKNNKFYIGSDSVFDRNWGRKTLNEAIKCAEQVMNSQDRDEVFIVKIVKVVRRKQAPIEVIDV